MSQIIIVKEKPYSFNNTEIVLNGGEQYIFGIKDLYDEKDENTLTWKIYKADGGILKEKTGKCNEKLTCSIDKKLCGDYRYELEAIVKQPDTTILSTQKISLGGYCTPKILSYKTNIPKEIKPEQGINADFEIEVEGLNGNYLILDLWFSDPNYIGYSTSAKGIEGKAKAKIIYIWSKLPKSNFPKFGSFKFTKGHSFPFLRTKSLRSSPSSSSSSSSKLEAKDSQVILSIKLKDASGEYVRESDNKVFILNMDVTSDFKAPSRIPLPSLPSNKTNATVNQSEEINMEVNGIIELEKITFTTKFNVCNDELRGDYDLWLLDDNCHWLKERIDMNDKKKPNPLPITLPGNKAIELEAMFNTIIDIDSIKIRIRDKSGTFLFPIESHGKEKKGNEFTITLLSSTPPLREAKYLENFELIFEYSLNEITWVPLCFAKFCLYLTREEPFYTNSLLKPPYINETLLWLSCTAATGLTNEDDIINAIFSKLKKDNLKVTRKREGDSKYLTTDLSSIGIGYWRGNSSVKTNFKLTSSRPHTLQAILGKYGEGRCGEWSQFFIYLCNTQNISSLKDLSIMSKGIAQTYWPISKLQEEYNLSKSPLDQYEEVPVQIVDGRIDHPIEYEEEVISCFLVNNPDKCWNIINGNEPEQLIARAQGNDNPLHFFWDHVLILVTTSSREYKYYDPSYGAEGSLHSNCKDIIKEYVKKCFTALLKVSITKKADGKKFKDKHTDMYINFIVPYLFERNEISTPKQSFQYIIPSDIEDELDLYFL